jgi:hypothetical protein
MYKFNVIETAHKRMDSALYNFTRLATENQRKNNQVEISEKSSSKVKQSDL